MKKVLMIIGGIVIGLVIIGVVVFAVVSLTTSKLKCTSTQGNITLMYNDKSIAGYTASGIGYDLDEQKAIAELIGVEPYLEQFTKWFEQNTDGTCTR